MVAGANRRGLVSRVVGAPFSLVAGERRGGLPLLHADSSVCNYAYTYCICFWSSLSRGQCCWLSCSHQGVLAASQCELLHVLAGRRCPPFGAASAHASPHGCLPYHTVQSANRAPL